jgi:hypothetical protein
MKTFVAIVASLAILAGPAYAQLGKGSGSSAGTDQRAQQAAKAEKERAAIEKEYNDTMTRLRSQGPAPKTDPWGKLRPANGADAKR